ncbi:MAG: 50S ribosomal protein L16 [Candidatus Diapherotrites archaeon]|nr:50S ribosomal protein L16 [Candidatus Diapherotrites archaeon]
MGLRPAHCYHDPDKDRAYTRMAIRVHKRNYIGAVPGLRTRQFNMGNPEREYNTLINLICVEKIFIRDNALESIRMLVNRKLVKLVGKDSFYIKLRMYPFHILRENKQAQGAHADRIQTGMSHPFGKAIGRAIRAKKNQVILSILIDDSNKDKVKSVLKSAKSRLPCAVRIDESKDVKSIGTKPKKRRKEEAVETKTEEVAATDKKDAKATDKKDAGKTADKKDTKATDKKDEKKDSKKK